MSLQEITIPTSLGEKYPITFSSDMSKEGPEYKGRPSSSPTSNSFVIPQREPNFIKLIYYILIVYFTRKGNIFMRMNLNILRTYIKELLFEAFSEGTISDLIKKFKKEDPKIDENEIRFYLKKFSDVQGSLDVSQKNIQNYSWHTRQNPDGTEIFGLKDFIDSKWSTRSFHEKTEITGDLEPVYANEDGTLQVFLGDAQEKCVTIRQKFENRTGERYTWCISRSDSSNLFRSYRYRDPAPAPMDQPVFYYIFDTERDKSDPLHACVMHVTNDGKYRLTDANNKADKTFSWSTLVAMMPKIKEIKGVFKHIPLTDRQLETHIKTKKELSDQEFARLTRDLKEDYISKGHRLSEEQIRNIWSLPKGHELVNAYCNRTNGVIIPPDIYKKLPGSTKKVIQDNAWNKELHDFLYGGKTNFEGYTDLRDLPSTTEMPETITVDGDLHIGGNKITKLPSNLEVTGKLSVKGANITELPANLKVGGALIIQGTGISSIPPGLNLIDLDISDTQVKEIPSGIRCDNLKMENCEINSVDNVVILKSLMAANSKLTQLPEGLDLISVDVSDTPMSRLPEKFTFERLDISGTRITELPSVLNVTDTLNISDTGIKSFPPEMRVNTFIARNTKITSLGGKIEIKDVDFGESPIEKIEPGLIVKGHLDLSGLKLKFLPEITVTGTLSLENSEVEQISPLTKAHRFVFGENLTSLPENFSAKGEVEIRNNTRMKHIPRINAKTLVLASSQVETMAEGSNLEGIYIYNSSPRLPDNLKIKYLIIKDSNIQTLPQGLVVDRLDLEKTKIKSLPPDIVVNARVSPPKFNKMYKQILEKRKSAMAESFNNLKKLIRMTLQDLI